VTAAGGDGVRAVLFDLDGVLVDSYRAWFLAVNDAAREFGAPGVDEPRFGGVWGQGISADVKNLYPGRTHREVEAAYERAMSRHGSAVAVNPEAAAALDLLGAAGLARACVTNTQEGLARAVLRAAGLDSRFDDLRGMREGIREKPAPDLLLAALQRFGASPASALMVGDSRYDEEAARAAEVPFLRYDLREGGSLVEALTTRLAGTLPRPAPGARR
jgi:phosphoglycolate phosphatase